MRVIATASRRLRRASLSLLPPRQRAALRRLYETTMAPPTGARAVFTERDGTVTIQIDGGPDIRIDPACRSAFELHFTSREAAAEVGHILQSARCAGVLFDVGANSGVFSLLYCLAHPQNHAIAFEPSAELAERIRRLSLLNGVGDRLQVIAKAVADSTEERELLLAGRGGFVQVAPFDGTAQNEWRRVTIEATTLDSVLAAGERPTIVKIDVEGFESEVLRGARTLIASSRPTFFLELHLNYLEQRRISPVDVIRELTAHGYDLVDLRGHSRTARDIQRSWASVLHLIARPQ